MAEIVPFRGWRFDPAVAGEPRDLLAPPYDVIDTAAQRALDERGPYNIIRIELTAAEAGDPPGAAGEAVRHARARATLDAWIAAGVLRRDERPALYLYAQRFAHHDRAHTRHTLLTAAKLAPWGAGEILPHEHTLAGPKAERLSLLRAAEANISPIWSLYEDAEGRVGEILARLATTRPLLDCTDDQGQGHALWALTDGPAIAAIRAAIGAGPLYIADGHHRYETALAFRDEAPGQGARDHVLMALTAVDDPGLVVLPTHRLMHGVPDERLAALPEALPRLFHVREAAAPTDAARFPALLDAILPAADAERGVHRFALLGPAADRLLVLRPREHALSESPPAPSLGALDVWLAHTLLLERCLGLDAASVTRQEHLTYTRDATEALAAVRAGGKQLALFLAPTPVSQLLAVARSGAAMPQKSTYFYPKLATGLVLRLLRPD